MTQGTVGILNVDIRGRLDNLDKQLKLAESKAAKSAKKMDATFSGVAGKALKAFAVLGTVELAVKAATAASDAFKGEWESARAVIKTLPFGIGSVAGAIEGVLDRMLGVTAEAEKFKKLNADIAKKMTARADAAKAEAVAAKKIADEAARLAGVNAGVRSTSLGTIQELQLIQAPEGITRDIIAAKQNIDNRLAELDKAIADGASREVIDREKALLGALKGLQIAALREAEALRLAAIEERKQAEIKAAKDAQAAIQAAANSVKRTADQQLEVLNAPEGLDRLLVKINQDFENQLRALSDALGGDFSSDAAQGALAALKALQDKQIKQATAQDAEATRKQIEAKEKALKKSIQKRLADEKRAQEQVVKDRQRLQDQIQAAQSQIRSRELSRISTNFLDLTGQRIKAGGSPRAQQIQKTEDAILAKKLDRLIELQQSRSEDSIR